MHICPGPITTDGVGDGGFVCANTFEAGKHKNIAVTNKHQTEIRFKRVALNRFA